MGGKNTLPMAELKLCLEKLGFSEVSTFLNSGNALFSTDEKSAEKLARQIEAALLQTFTFDSDLIKVLVLSRDELRAVIQSAPKDFGKHPETYHSDVAFLMTGNADEAVSKFVCNPEVDTVWAGRGVIFYQRLSSQRTKSRLSKIMARPIYKSLTIRTWTTVNKLYQRMSEPL